MFQNFFSEGVAVKVALVQKNHLEKMTVDKAFLRIYLALVTCTTESSLKLTNVAL